MSKVVLAARDMNERRKHVTRLVAPLLIDRNRVEVRPIGSGQAYTLGVIPKGQSPASISSPDAVRVPTKVESIFLNYYEAWVSDAETGGYLLERAYMHIHHKRTKDAPDRQILCLHCDPLLEKKDPSFVYKRGPHLHIGGAAPNIDRSHISVCLNDPQQGGGDVASLTSTLQLAVTMIDREIFPLYRTK